MNEVITFLSSPAWWFTAVFVGIVVNIISSYLRDGTDWTWKYAKRKLKTRENFDTQSKRVAESNSAFLEQLLTDETLRRFLVEAEMRARLMSLELWFLGLACAALGYYFMIHPQEYLPSIVGRGMGLFSVLVLYYGGQKFALGHSLSLVLLQVERARRVDINKTPK